MSEIEDRVAQLEADIQELRHLGKVRHDALGDALNRTHADLLAFREETRHSFTEVNGRIDDLSLTMASRLDRIERLIEERLPPAGDA